MDLIPLILVMPVLLIAAVFDMRHLRIPNQLTAVALVLFTVCCPFLPMSEIWLRLLFAGLVFVVGFSLFALHIVGGGDVKILSALILFIPSGSLTLFAYVFAISLLVGIVGMLCLRAIPFRFASHWESLQQGGTLPMGISIAMAGMLQLFLLAHFSH